MTPQSRLADDRTLQAIESFKALVEDGYTGSVDIHLQDGLPQMMEWHQRKRLLKAKEETAPAT